MTIKSILLGTAAALAATTGVQAADAIVAADPEPVEYVRVCDAFGTGYFYIPGTETCLRVHGYVRYDIGVGELFAVQSATGDDTYFKQARFSFQVSTASETELGTLRTFVETRFQWNTVDTGAGYTTGSEFTVNFAWIQLGGLRIGKDESFFTTFTGYAGNVINDTLATGVDYGQFDTNLLSYTYSAGAFSAGISLEQGDDSPGWGIDDYMPHVVAGLGYDAGMFNVRGVVAYDTRDGVGEGGWAAKLRADVTISDSASVFAMLMYGENSSAYTGWANGAAGDETLGVIAGGSVSLSDKATFNLQATWIDGSATTDDIWAVAANVAYELVPGLTITPEVAYRDDGATDEFGGYLRFERSF